MEQNHTGSCLCRKVVFEIDGSFDRFFLCHCEYCRKDTGSAYAANLFSSTAKLRWLSGENNIKTFDFESSGHIKSFCADCGSAIPNIQMNGTLFCVCLPVVWIVKYLLCLRDTFTSHIELIGIMTYIKSKDLMNFQQKIIFD